MKIIVNGESIDTPCDTLGDMLEHLGYAQKTVATALNNEFVAESNRSTTTLQPHDVVEIVAPMSGG